MTDINLKNMDGRTDGDKKEDAAEIESTDMRDTHTHGLGVVALSRAM